MGNTANSEARHPLSWSTAFDAKKKNKPPPEGQLEGVEVRCCAPFFDFVLVFGSFLHPAQDHVRYFV